MCPAKRYTKRNFDNKDTKNELKEFKFMAYEKMIPLLTEALQEQQKTIEELKQRIEVLEMVIKYNFIVVHMKM